MNLIGSGRDMLLACDGMTDMFAEQSRSKPRHTYKL